MPLCTASTDHKLNKILKSKSCSFIVSIHRYCTFVFFPVPVRVYRLYAVVEQNLSSFKGSIHRFSTIMFFSCASTGLQTACCCGTEIEVKCPSLHHFLLKDPCPIYITTPPLKGNSQICLLAFATKNSIIRNLMSKISLYVWGLG